MSEQTTLTHANVYARVQEQLRTSIRRSYVDYTTHQAQVIPEDCNAPGAIFAAVAHVQMQHPYTSRTTIEVALEGLIPKDFFTSPISTMPRGRMRRSDFLALSNALSRTAPLSRPMHPEMGPSVVEVAQHMRDCRAVADAIAEGHPRFDVQRFLQDCGARPCLK